jgi:hypothetical protein
VGEIAAGQGGNVGVDGETFGLLLLGEVGEAAGDNGPRIGDGLLTKEGRVGREELFLRCASESGRGRMGKEQDLAVGVRDEKRGELWVPGREEHWCGHQGEVTLNSVCGRNEPAAEKPARRGRHDAKAAVVAAKKKTAVGN